MLSSWSFSARGPEPSDPTCLRRAQLRCLKKTTEMMGKENGSNPAGFLVGRWGLGIKEKQQTATCRIGKLST